MFSGHTEDGRITRVQNISVLMWGQDLFYRRGKEILKGKSKVIEKLGVKFERMWSFLCLFLSVMFTCKKKMLVENRIPV